MSRGEILDALIASGHLSIIPVGFTGQGEGEGGYHTRFTGAYVCYTCGHLCECGEGGEE